MVNQMHSTGLGKNNNLVMTDPARLLIILDDWARAGWIRWLDTEFAVFLHRQVPDASPALLLAAALTSHQNGHGHVCLDIHYCLSEPGTALSLPPESPVRQPELTPQQLLAQLDSAQWTQALHNALLVDDKPGTDMQAEAGNQPLVLDSSSGRPLLYLRRFWRYEQTLAHSIQQRLLSRPDVDDRLLSSCIKTIFEQLSQNTAAELTRDCDWQRIACGLAVRQRFSIITGGPGTGKTTTVVKVLAVLQALQHAAGQPPLRIRLAAPTGKAAARLSTSITSQLARHDLQGVPGDVSTVHRLLGPVRNSRFFRHHAGNPLPVDVVVVDEASMVDVELMALLLDALPAQARLVLLGDKDQLASVEAGAVLGSLCQRAALAHYWQQTSDWITSVTGQHVPDHLINNDGTGLDQAITMLRYSHRFGAVPGIGDLAQAVNSSADANTLNAFFDGQYSELKRLHIGNTRDTAFEQLIADLDNGYGHYLSLARQPPATEASSLSWDTWALDILQAHGHFQLLAALRKGEFGVEGLNQRIESILRSAGLLPPWQERAFDTDDARSPAPTQAAWYPGRPVMVTRNDYNLDLMNGDIGITLPYPLPVPGGTELRLRVAFTAGDKQKPVRWVLPSRLQSVETVFAMTVHKSQGSEFTHTALILPQHENPVLTRELIYTGITRAVRQFTLIDNNPKVLPGAVASSVFRTSGLLHAISGS
ncbi:exodeoxyribonuclease V subunit alpha [Pseudohongiella acticola]|nr:exodeoxyribonuclease V subunit alpha [Pseudohongiella acticola]